MWRGRGESRDLKEMINQTMRKKKQMIQNNNRFQKMGMSGMVAGEAKAKIEEKAVQ